MGDQDVYNFTYSGTKLTKIDFQLNNGNTTAGYSKFVYTGNLITEVKDYNSNNINTFNTTFTYDANSQLTQVLKVQVGVDFAQKSVFTYNTDNTVDAQHFNGTATAQTSLSAMEKFYFENNLLVQKDYTYGSTANTQTKYNYDTANHPMKNVMGIEAIKLYVNSYDGFLSLGLKGVSNNIVKETVYLTPGVVDNVVTFETVYNDKNYPISIYSTADSPGPYSYQYEYY